MGLGSTAFPGVEKVFSEVGLVGGAGWSFAELGVHAPLIHVEIPNRGRIQAWRANQATKKATNTHNSDIFVLPMDLFEIGC